MSSVTVHIDSRPRRDSTHSIYIRVAHRDERRKIPTGMHVLLSQYKSGKVIKHPDALLINSRISEMVGKIEKYLADCQVRGRPADLSLALQERHSHSFNAYLKSRARHYRDKQMLIMSRKTARIEAELQECFNREVYFEDITADLLRQYDAWLVGRGNAQNTRHKKFKFLQQFFSQAVQEGRHQGANPFKQYKINPKPVGKEKLTREEIAALEAIELTEGPVRQARDLFLFSYYTKGQRFESCVTCRASQVVNDRLLFRTNKGNKHISVQIHSRLQEIINRYAGSEFVFPYVKELPTDQQSYISLIGVLNVIVNRNLKIAAGLAGIKRKVTFHVARHSFAFHLKQVTDNMHVISESLGHSDYRTTEIYLKSLDDTVLDKEMMKLYGK